MLDAECLGSRDVPELLREDEGHVALNLFLSFLFYLFICLLSFFSSLSAAEPRVGFKQNVERVSTQANGSIWFVRQSADGQRIRDSLILEAL